MKIRAVAAAALALALGAGLTGCNMISPQRTTMEYAASDGVNVDLGDIAVRNALLVVDSDTETASQANLVFTAVNPTDQNAQITVAVAGGAPTQIALPNNPESDVVKVGFGDTGPQLVTGQFVSGTTVEVKFTATYTDAEGAQQTQEVTHLVPVLGATDPANVLEEYSTLAPGSGANAPATTPATPGEEGATDGETPAATDGVTTEETDAPVEG